MKENAKLLSLNVQLRTNIFIYMKKVMFIPVKPENYKLSESVLITFSNTPVDTDAECTQKCIQNSNLTT